MEQIVAAKRIAKVLSQKMSTRRLKVLASSDGTYLPPCWLSLDRVAQLKLRDLLSWERLSRGDFDIFEVDKVTKHKHTLSLISWAILASPNAQHAMDLTCNEHTCNDTMKSGDISRERLLPTHSRPGYGFIEEFNMKQDALFTFLQIIEQNYFDNPYHNAVHAADVCQSLHVILQMTGNRFFSSKENKMESFAALLAAIVHDIGHPGRNNAFQQNSRSELALRYNDQSILENFHAASAFQIMMGENTDPGNGIFASFSDKSIGGFQGSGRIC